MLTDDILQDLTQENVVFQKEYTRQVYDTKSIITNGSPLKDSSVTYLKIKRGVIVLAKLNALEILQYEKAIMSRADSIKILYQELKLVYFR